MLPEHQFLTWRMQLILEVAGSTFQGFFPPCFPRMSLIRLPERGTPLHRPVSPLLIVWVSAPRWLTWSPTEWRCSGSAVAIRAHRFLPPPKQPGLELRDLSGRLGICWTRAKEGVGGGFPDRESKRRRSLPPRPALTGKAAGKCSPAFVACAAALPQGPSYTSGETLFHALGCLVEDRFSCRQNKRLLVPQAPALNKSVKPKSSRTILPG